MLTETVLASGMRVWVARPDTAEEPINRSNPIISDGVIIAASTINRTVP